MHMVQRMQTATVGTSAVRRRASAAADAAKVRSLRRMKFVALSLLLAATALFVAMRLIEDEAGSWADYVRAFAEAAMVGALADWFAVTALFRHPLGIPIPHTAIIPERKNQIGRSLGEFVQDNFLTKEVVTERLEGMQVGRRLGQWLAERANAARAGQAAADALHGALEIVDDDDVGRAIEQLVIRRAEAIEAAPLVGKAIDIAIEGGHHQQLLDAALRGISHFLDENRAVLRSRLDKESPWWLPEPIDDRIFNKIFGSVQRFLTDVQEHPDHEVRQNLETQVLAFARRLRDDPALAERGEQLKGELLAHPEVRAWIGSLWSELKRTLLDASRNPSSELRARLDAGIRGLGTRIVADESLQHKIDHWVEGAVSYVAENYQHEVANLIATTVERWDAESTSRRLELQVGRDLQFIRINGTIVGGLAGLLIFTFGRAIA
jgi:uncharacterized membrane-anchored protein YjiN (DUF445 family)